MQNSILRTLRYAEYLHTYPRCKMIHFQKLCFSKLKVNLSHFTLIRLTNFQHHINLREPSLLLFESTFSRLIYLILFKVLEFYPRVDYDSIIFERACSNEETSYLPEPLHYLKTRCRENFCSKNIHPIM